MTTEAAATEATTTTEAPATTETAAVETPAAVEPPKTELLAAKLEAIRLKNAERKARNSDFDARQKALEERENSVKSWKDDPRAALLATGLPPREALDELVRQAHLEGTPEGEIAALKKELNAETATLKAELATLKAERDAERAERDERQSAAKQQEAEQHFVSTTLAAEKYAPLRALRPDNGAPIYATEELARLGNHYAEQLRAAGTLSKSDPLGSVADAILADHLAWASRFGPAPAATPASVPAGKTVNGGRTAPNTLSNVGSESTPTGPMTFEQKLERAKRKFAAG